MKIALLGDIALIGRYDQTITSNVEKRIEEVGRIVNGCDCVIGNLESPLTEKTKTLACKGVYLRSAPSNVELLKLMGITHVTIANNHIYDYGQRGAKDTIATLEKAGIKFIGLNNEPELVKMEHDIIAIDGLCCLSANALNYGNTIGKVKMLTYEALKAFLDYCVKRHYFPIASVHFGIEGLHFPSREHINLFRKLASDYDYILHGNHPHAMQGVEQINNSLLIYAQGNLCFDKTPVTSIHYIPEEQPEERKCYISIIEIAKGKLVSHNHIGLTDLQSGFLHRDKQIDTEREKYSKILSEELDLIEAKRNEELQNQIEHAQKRNLNFFLNRINYKYVGAYINGKRHAKEYKFVIGRYYDQIATRE